MAICQILSENDQSMSRQHIRAANVITFILLPKHPYSFFLFSLIHTHIYRSHFRLLFGIEK